jgi:uncharacterized protein YdiU (UPF0061 family)
MQSVNPDSVSRSWDVQFASDERPSLKVFGTHEEAVAKAERFNKYKESFTIKVAARKDYELEKEQALAEAIKYSCSTVGMK